MIEQYLSTKQVCLLLSFSLSSFYRYCKVGLLEPSFFTPGGHRRFSLNSIRQTFAINNSAQSIVCYSRVSSHDQKKDLIAQEAKLINYAQKLPNFNKLNNNIISITDLGSGLNYKKKGLNKLISLIFSNQINTLVLNHK